MIIFSRIILGITAFGLVLQTSLRIMASLCGAESLNSGIAVKTLFAISMVAAYFLSLIVARTDGT
jgi:hypothetical protein